MKTIEELQMKNKRPGMLLELNKSQTGLPCTIQVEPVVSGRSSGSIMTDKPR